MMVARALAKLGLTGHLVRVPVSAARLHVRQPGHSRLLRQEEILYWICR